jgi:uncharacterized protein
MRTLLEYMVRNLVDQPEAVQIRERATPYAVNFRLSVSSQEAGKIIGRNGRVAKAIRDLVAVAAARQGKRVHIDIE